MEGVHGPGVHGPGVHVLYFPLAKAVACVGTAFLVLPLRRLERVLAACARANYTRHN